MRVFIIASKDHWALFCQTVTGFLPSQEVKHLMGLYKQVFILAFTIHQWLLNMKGSFIMNLRNQPWLT